MAKVAEQQRASGAERHRLAAFLAELLVVGAGFFVLATLSLIFTGSAQRIAAVWLPNAAVYIYLLRRGGMPRLPVLLAGMAGNIAANLEFGDPLTAAAGLAVANAAEIFVATTLTRRFCGARPDLHDFGVVGRLLGITGVAAPALSATIAAGVLTLVADAHYFTVWLQWFVTDGLDLTLGGFCLLAFCDGYDQRHEIRRDDLQKNLLLFAAGTVVLVLIFYQSSYPLLFLAAPMVLIHTLRQRMLGTALATLKIALIATVATVLGHGPLALVQNDVVAKAYTLQLFLVTVLLMGMPVAALLDAKRRTLRDLADRERQLSLLADWSSDAVMAFDTNGVCCFATVAAERLFGLSQEAILGQPATSLMRPQDAYKYDVNRDRLVAAHNDFETLVFCPAGEFAPGTERYLEACCTRIPRNESSDIMRVIASIRDVTDRVRLEQDLIAAREHAEQATLVKSRFLANMSHEIRTPMNGVLGFAELLANGDLTETQRRHAELIVESGKSMMRLLNNILDVSKIEVGDIKAAQEPLDLRHVLRSCVSLNLALAQQSGLDLRFQIARNLPSLISGDALRLRQIILNLLGNAIKFTAAGTVTLSARQAEGRLQIAITDTGMGIAADRLQSIFAPFEQADNDISRHFGGTGLGLSISRQLAELMDGTLTAKSQPGSGSCFTLTVPLIVVERIAPLRAAKVSKILPNPANGRRRVLLVDDHDINRELATEMLSRLGCTVTVACNGIEAVALVSEAEADNAFDLVLMDVQMPICDGYEATRAIRRDCSAQRDLPIVAMTANAYPEDIAAARAAGMQDHLAKPITTADLRQILDRWLDPAACAVPVDTSVPSTIQDRLQQLWRKSRNDAVAQAQAFLEREDDPKVRAELERVVHRIAGTAARFDEAPLGVIAASLENTLRRGGSNGELRVLAKQFLALN